MKLKKQTQVLMLGAVALALAGVLGGCELIVDFDRTKIDGGTVEGGGSDVVTMTDGSIDTGTDGTMNNDSGVDTGTDSPTSDTGTDTGVDTGADAPDDAPDGD